MAEKDKELEKKADAPKAEVKKETGAEDQVEPMKAEASQAPEDKGKAQEDKTPPVLSNKVEAPKPEKKQTKKASAQKKAAEKPPKQKTTKQKSPSRGPAWLALLLALIASGGAGYTYWMFSKYTVADRSSTKDVEQRALQAIESQTKSLVSDIETQKQQLNVQKQSVNEFGTRLSATRRQINEITHVSRRSWMLAEAEYLLRLANQRLVMEREVNSPLALLKAADEILLSVDDVNLYPIRAEVAKEIEALRATGRTDIEGIFLKLNALEQQVATLPLLSTDTDEKSVEAATASENVVVRSLDSVLSRFNDLVRINDRAEPVEALLSPEQHRYVQQNLRLMMEQAQLALLQQRSGLYTQSLEKAEKWVHSYFRLNESTDALLASLAELKKVNVTPDLPNISASLALLKQYLSNPDVLLEQKGEPDAAAGQANIISPESGES